MNTPTNKKPKLPIRFFWFSMIFIAICVAIANCEDDKKSGKEKTHSGSYVDSTLNSDTLRIDLKTRISNTIISLDKTNKDISESDLSISDIKITAALLKAYALTIQEGNYSSDTEILKLTSKLKSKLISFQKLILPKLRKQYYKYIKNTLWENDVEVSISGKDNTILSLSGHYFITNKNKAECQNAIYEMVNLLRFKQIRYTWYNGQEQYTYYNLETPKDSDIHY